MPFPSCVVHLGSLSSCGSVAHRITYNILVSAAGMFTWRLTYVVSLFCFSYWCWSAHKSLAPRTRTLLGVLGQATLNFVAVATLLFFCFL